MSIPVTPLIIRSLKLHWQPLFFHM